MTSGENPKMESPLKAVIELHRALRDLDERETLLNGIPDWMRELHDDHAAHQKEIAAIEADLEEAASERRAWVVATVVAAAALRNSRRFMLTSPVARRGARATGCRPRHSALSCRPSRQPERQTTAIRRSHDPGFGLIGSAASRPPA